MSKHWSIKAEWESLETGSPEEMAGFAALGICAHGSWLTEGHDRVLQSVRQSPLLSAYHLAEWFAWNWWRLRWEPRKASKEWGLSHRVACIGNGYIWPDISVITDGEKITLVTKPTPERERTPFRYINDSISVIQASDFESEVDVFIDKVLQRLKDRHVPGSNLEAIWTSVLEERQTPSLARHRKLEALLGEDPDELPREALQNLIEEEAKTGSAAIEEIAADRTPEKGVPNAAHLIEIGRKDGFVARAADRVSLAHSRPVRQDVFPVAWKLGAEAAQALRKQENLGEEPISNKVLADMFGTPTEALDPNNHVSDIGLSFALDEPDSLSHVLLRSKWENGRRFELARLLGDHLVSGLNEPMRPATRSNTYRQKAQRAFAAELLSPFHQVDSMLKGDYSMENQQDVAHYFNVSEWTIRTMLVNYGRIDRGELELM